MQQTLIPWTDYTLNPITGCTYGCQFCYARKKAENPFFRKAFPNGFKPSFYPERLKHLDKIPDGSKVFICSMGELFGENEDWTYQILQKISVYNNLTFQLLTKQYHKLKKWSPFPPNCWVGGTVTNLEQLIKVQVHLSEIKSTVKFASVEPMLPELDILPEGYWLGLIESIDWVILGSQTKPTKHPEKKTVKLAISCADYLHKPVFIKEPLSSHMNIQRQEFPEI